MNLLRSCLNCTFYEERRKRKWSERGKGPSLIPIDSNPSISFHEIPRDLWRLHSTQSLEISVSLLKFSIRLYQAPLGSIGLHQAPLGSIGLHQAPLGPIRPHQALLGPIRLHQAPIGSTGFLRGPRAQAEGSLGLGPLHNRAVIRFSKTFLKQFRRAITR